MSWPSLTNEAYLLLRHSQIAEALFFYVTECVLSGGTSSFLLYGVGRSEREADSLVSFWSSS
jgi:hypothetical protein